MFNMNNYRIIENKEEFLKDWNSSWERYDHGIMPRNFSIDKAEFPMGLRYYPDYEPHCCGSWHYVSIEEAKEEILKSYDDKINFLMEKKEKLKLLKD